MKGSEMIRVWRRGFLLKTETAFDHHGLKSGEVIKLGAFSSDRELITG
jgi:hypothetical protein